jgi:putative tryptophan/tyrosine transport system substrate-binding protein
MRRREFIGLVGTAATVWSLAARAQQADPIRKLGVLVNFTSDDPEGEARIQAFSQSLRKLGWIEGDNLQTEIRWAGDDADRYHRYAKELVSSAPHVILASASPSVSALQQVTQSVPIVFANVIDPVGAGFIASLARPGGNTTGFTAFEYSISSKWLELLNELVPGLKRVAVVREPSIAAGIGQFAAIQTLASSSSGLELTAIDPRDSKQIERALTAFAREPNGGVIVTASASAVTHRDLLLALALRYRLPAVYPFRYYVASGGLAAYGPDTIAVYVRAADYVHRILKGAKPADLPVQAPTKYELVINLKTAKALGITVPSKLLAVADEVIE